jgi:hypothetical protein
VSLYAFDQADGALPGGFAVLAGAVTVKANRAFASNVATGSIAVVDFPGGQDARAACQIGGAGGYALYFRVVDTGNWWRLAVGYSSSSYSYPSGTEQYIVTYQDVPSGTTQVPVGQEQYIADYRDVPSTTSQLVGYNYWTEYGMFLVNPVTNAWVQPYQHQKRVYHYYPQQGYPGINEFPDEPTDVPGDYGHVYRAQPSTMFQGYDPVYQDVTTYTKEPIYGTRTIYETQTVYSRQPVYGTRTVYSTGTGYSWELRLEKAVGGAVTTVQSVTLTAALSSLNVSFQGSAIACYSSASPSTPHFTTVDATHSSSTRHGIGYAASAIGNTDGVDLFEVLPYNAPPSAPVLLSPAPNQTVNRAQSLRVTWRFSDPNPLDAQGSAVVRWRPIGTPTWTSQTASGPNQFYDVPAGTLPVGDLEWQVSTTDSAGAPGPWSASGFFTAVEAPPGPTITAPGQGDTIAGTSAVVTWSTTGQDAYDVRTVGDNAGAADTSVIYTDTGVVESPAARAETVAFTQNGAHVHVQVQVRKNGLWSPWADVPVTVSFAEPPQAGVSLTVLPADGYVQVQVYVPQPVSPQPRVSGYRVWRRAPGEGPVPMTPLVSAGIGAWIDRTVSSRIDYSYQVETVGENGATALSPWTTTGVLMPTTPTTAGAYGAGAYGEGPYS